MPRSPNACRTAPVRWRAARLDRLLDFARFAINAQTVPVIEVGARSALETEPSDRHSGGKRLPPNQFRLGMKTDQLAIGCGEHHFARNNRSRVKQTSGQLLTGFRSAMLRAVISPVSSSVKIKRPAMAMSKAIAQSQAALRRASTKRFDGSVLEFEAIDPLPAVGHDDFRLSGGHRRDGR